MAITPDGKLAVTAHKEAGSLTVVDLGAGAVAGSIPCPGGAEEVDVSPDGRFAYAATPLMAVDVNVKQGRSTAGHPARHAASRVLKIDLATRAVVGELAIDEVLRAAGGARRRLPRR